MVIIKHTKLKSSEVLDSGDWGQAVTVETDRKAGLPGIVGKTVVATDCLGLTNLILMVGVSQGQSTKEDPVGMRFENVAEGIACEACRSSNLCPAYDLFLASTGHSLSGASVGRIEDEIRALLPK